MSHQPYAPFSLECPKEIIRIVRGGTVQEELPLFAKCAHTLAGTAIGATIGEPPEVQPLFGSGEQPSKAEVEECIGALEEVQGGTFGAGEGGREKGLGPVALLLIDLAITALKEWLSNQT